MDVGYEQLIKCLNRAINHKIIIGIICLMAVKFTNHCRTPYMENNLLSSYIYLINVLKF